jgi:hypothetical protein
LAGRYFRKLAAAAAFARVTDNRQHPFGNPATDFNDEFLNDE